MKREVKRASGRETRTTILWMRSDQQNGHSADAKKKMKRATETKHNRIVGGQLVGRLLLLSSLRLFGFSGVPTGLHSIPCPRVSGRETD